MTSKAKARGGSIDSLKIRVSIAPLNLIVDINIINPFERIIAVDYGGRSTAV